MPALTAVLVPDLGTDDPVEIIELSVQVGDELKPDDSIITLESEKASMDIPAPFAGIVAEIKVQLGDKVTQGSVILMLEKTLIESSQENISEVIPDNIKPDNIKPDNIKPDNIKPDNIKPDNIKPDNIKPDNIKPDNIKPVKKTNIPLSHATPAVRRLAREFGVDLQQVVASGRKERIIPEDIQKYVKQKLAQVQNNNNNTSLFDSYNIPEIDFSKFGDIEVKDLSKINKLSAQNLHRNWVTIPHVTQFDEIDITELEAFRQKHKKTAEQRGFKLTILVFLLKAVVKALEKFPKFNSSLGVSGQQIILKKYYNIGVAVDTPQGLVVPVLRDVDQKSAFDLAEELANISQKARALKLMPKDMSGGCFTLSSLGGIGGTAFTPIINAPEVAILGISKAQIKPIYNDNAFDPKLLLPLSLSYDHRVIDGADAARFIAFLGTMLADIRCLLL